MRSRRAVWIYLKREILIGIDVHFDLFHHRFFRELMHRVTVNIDRLVRPGEAG
jgi:hypothetical protein